jgi:hypothetical protein
MFLLVPEGTIQASILYPILGTRWSGEAIPAVFYEEMEIYCMGTIQSMNGGSDLNLLLVFRR